MQTYEAPVLVIRYVAKFSLVASGSVDDFDEAKKAQISAKVASEVGAAPSDVKTTVTPASVQITSTVIFTNEDAALTASTKLKERLGSQEAATAFLQAVPGLEEVTVEQAPTHSTGSVVVREDGSLQEVDMSRQKAAVAEIMDLHPGVIVGIIIGGVLVIVLSVLSAILLRRLLRMSKDRWAKMKQVQMQKEKTGDIFATMDTDGDGNISQEEFTNFMQRHLVRGLTKIKLMGSSSNLMGSLSQRPKGSSKNLTGGSRAGSSGAGSSAASSSSSVLNVLEKRSPSEFGVSVSDVSVSDTLASDILVLSASAPDPAQTTTLEVSTPPSYNPAMDPDSGSPVDLKEALEEAQRAKVRAELEYQEIQFTAAKAQEKLRQAQKAAEQAEARLEQQGGNGKQGANGKEPMIKGRVAFRRDLPARKSPLSGSLSSSF